jgi:hypothetical protein
MATLAPSFVSGAVAKPAFLRTVELAGPAGRLEALVNEGPAHASFAALVCHPHPMGGGTMHNKVVYRAMKAMNDPAQGLGWPVLRFNFRGVGLSQGSYDGEAEVGDVLAALDWLEREYRLPLVLVGFSFGAAMALSACCDSTRLSHNLRAAVALGLPLQAEDRAYHYPHLASCTLPKLFISGDHDSFAPVAALEQVVRSAAEPKRLQLISDADHFFTGQLEAMQHALTCWLKEQPE